MTKSKKDTVGGKPKVVVASDIDGVIATNSAKRESKKMVEYYSTCEPLPFAKQLPEDVILVTGRKERYRPVTEAWLKRHGVKYKRLFMNPCTGAWKDRNGLALLKAGILKMYNVDVFYEDDPRIARMVKTYCPKVSVKLVEDGETTEEEPKPKPKTKKQPKRKAKEPKLQTLGEGETEGRRWSLLRVPMDRLRFNPLNPNVMSEYRMGQLKKNLGIYGIEAQFPCGIFVEEKGTQTVFIVDGVNRCLARKEQGAETIVVSVLHDVSRVQAEMGAYSLNRFRGKLEPEKVGKLLFYCNEKFGEEEVRRISQLPRAQMQEYLFGIDNKDVIAFGGSKKIEEIDGDIIQRGLRELYTIPDAEFPRTVVMSFAGDKYEFVFETLDEIDRDMGKAVIKLCEFWKKHRDAA